MKLLTLILILTLPMVAQDDPLPPPDRLVAPDDSAAITDEEIDAAWAQFRRPTNAAAIQAKLKKWHEFCEGHGGLDFAEPLRLMDDGDPPRPVAAWSHPQTFGDKPIVLVRGANKIAMVEQLCLPVFEDGRKDERVLKAFTWLDRQLEDVQLVNKKQLKAAIENNRLTPVVAEVLTP